MSQNESTSVCSPSWVRLTDLPMCSRKYNSPVYKILKRCNLTFSMCTEALDTV
uniref:Uncharacterized protein n=1 Tax=Setaria italica TaxID=4555 RepID=K3XP87_SETIT